MARSKLVAPSLALLLFAVFALFVRFVDADGPSEKDKQEYQKRLDALNAELATALQELAAWCDKNGLPKQEVRHLKQAGYLVPSLKDTLEERLKKAQDAVAQNPPEPTDAVWKAYLAKVEELSRAFAKRYEELGKWASQHGMKDQGQETLARSKGLDPDVLAGDKGTSRLELAGGQKEQWNKVCAVRKIAGCAAVELDPALSAGAQAHARFLSINEGSEKLEGMGVHTEPPEMPGYTDEGAACASKCDIHWGNPNEAVDLLMATFYHRLPILQPRLTKIGVGRKDGFAKFGTALVIDLLQGVDPAKACEPSLVLWPIPDQTDVGRTFGGETPNPIPPGEKGTPGYPVTFTMYDDAKAVSDVTVARLLGPDGQEVACFASNPQKPALAGTSQENSICLIPKATLMAHARYTVQIKCTVGGQAVEKTWSFTTK